MKQQPLYGETFGASRLSRSTVSRVTQQLNQEFDTWRRRDLSDLPTVYLFLGDCSVDTPQIGGCAALF